MFFSTIWSLWSCAAPGILLPQSTTAILIYAKLIRINGTKYWTKQRKCMYLERKNIETVYWYCIINILTFLRITFSIRICYCKSTYHMNTVMSIFFGKHWGMDPSIITTPNETAWGIANIIAPDHIATRIIWNKCKCVYMYQWKYKNNK